MDSEKASLVICITIFCVVAFNAAIYAAVKRRKDSGGEIEIFRRAISRVRHPWQEEAANLETLARRVAELQKKSTNEENSDER